MEVKLDKERILEHARRILSELDPLRVQVIEVNESMIPVENTTLDGVATQKQYLPGGREITIKVVVW